MNIKESKLAISLFVFLIVYSSFLHDEMLENYDRYLPNRKKTDTEISKDPEWQKISEFAMQIYQDLKEARYTS